MSAPHPGTTATQGSPVESDAAGRHARIEQLLLSGLDHYFAGRYEQAIDIWTRVVFLERRHGRARAYIDRARSALAERQRESEELVHRGVEAYQQGRVEVARTLLTEAMAHGGAPDAAQALLEQFSRIEPAMAVYRKVVSAPDTDIRGRSDPSPVRWLPTVVACGAAVAVVAALASPVMSALAEWPMAAPTAPARVPPHPLPLPEPSEGRVRQARTLHAEGRSKEALRLLETVRLGDPLRPEADQLRAVVARSILTRMGAVGASAGDAATSTAELVSEPHP